MEISVGNGNSGAIRTPAFPSRLNRNPSRPADWTRNIFAALSSIAETLQLPRLVDHGPYGRSHYEDLRRGCGGSSEPAFQARPSRVMGFRYAAFGEPACPPIPARGRSSAGRTRVMTSASRWRPARSPIGKPSGLLEA